ncbi:MAG: hypothetical protein AB8I08_19045 [Sandaracinaceae bacterium]
MRWTLSIALLLASCGGTPPPPPEPPPPAAAPAPPPAPEPPAPPTLEEDAAPDGGAMCGASSECEGEQQCRGPAGCGADWACGEPRECGDETVSYCGCDNFTFYAQANCPGRPYQHTGPCEALGNEIDYEPEAVEGSQMCQSDDDCGRGYVCVGSAGCTTYWTCVRRWRVRPRCRRREARYCSCEGETISAAENCPGEPIAHAGYCAGDEPVVATAEPEPPPPVEPPVVTPPPVAPPPPVEPPVAVVPPPVEPPVVVPPPPVEPPAPLEPPPPPRYVVCTSNRDCGRGEVCQGPVGCGVEWRCGRPEERCIADTQRFCSCDGETFAASMTCPGRPHAHRGSCTAQDE